MQPVYLQCSKDEENIADFQLLEMFSNEALLLLPLTSGKKRLGVALLVLESGPSSISKSELKIINDLTDQLASELLRSQNKNLEEKKKETEYITSLKLALKKFAHEINNPLAIIHNYLKTIDIKYSDNDLLLDEIHIIGEEIERISSIVAKMGKLSPYEYEEPESVDVNTTLAEILKLCRPTLFNDERKKFLFSPDKTLPQANCSKNGLKHIVLNLLKNASEALEESGKVEIETSFVENALQCSRGVKTNSIMIHIRDNGPGLPEIVKNNLYKPYNTTKKSGHSGLGLSIVKKIITEMNGAITCTSDVNEGTSFKLYLPVEEEHL